MTAPQYTAPPVFDPPADDPNLYGRTLEIELPAGDQGQYATLFVMRAIVHDSDRFNYVTRLAAAVNARAKKRCGSAVVVRVAEQLEVGPCIIAKLFEVYDLVARCQRFIKDPARAEMPRHVDQLIHEIERTGKTGCDCDDAAMLGAALVRRLGFEAAFVAVGDTPTDRLRHVYYAVRLHDRWMPMDPQEGTPPFVWPARSVRREIFVIDD